MDKFEEKLMIESFREVGLTEDSLDKEMIRVWRTLRRNKVSGNKAAQIVSYARGLTADQLLVFAMVIFAGLGNSMAKKKLYKKLREAFGEKEWNEFQPLLVPLMEELYEDEPEEDDDTVPVTGMTLRQLLEMGEDKVRA